MPKGAGTPKGKSPAPRGRLPCGRWRSEAVSPREVFSVVEVAALVFFVQRHLPKTIAAGGRPGLGYSLRERRQLWGKVRRAMYRESGVRRTYQQATHRWSDILDREQDLLDLLGVEIPGLAPPRGKQAEGAAPADQDATTLDRSVEGSSAGPSVTPSAQPTTSAGASGEAPSTLGADAAEPATPVPSGPAAGDVSGVAGGDTPSKPSRKELAIRARRRKLEAIAVEYRRLVAQADAEEEAAAAVSSSSVPGSTSSPRRRPLGVRRRGPAAAHHRRGKSSTPTPNSILKARVRRLSLRVDHLELEVKALRKELRDLSRGGHRRRSK